MAKKTKSPPKKKTARAKVGTAKKSAGQKGTGLKGDHYSEKGLQAQRKKPRQQPKGRKMAGKARKIPVPKPDSTVQPDRSKRDDIVEITGELLEKFSMALSEYYASDWWKYNDDDLRAGGTWEDAREKIHDFWLKYLTLKDTQRRQYLSDCGFSEDVLRPTTYTNIFEEFWKTAGSPDAGPLKSIYEIVGHVDIILYSLFFTVWSHRLNSHKWNESGKWGMMIQKTQGAFKTLESEYFPMLPYLWPPEDAENIRKTFQLAAQQISAIPAHWANPQIFFPVIGPELDWLPTSSYVVIRPQVAFFQRPSSRPPEPMQIRIAVILLFRHLEKVCSGKPKVWRHEIIADLLNASVPKAERTYNAENVRRKLAAAEKAYNFENDREAEIFWAIRYNAVRAGTHMARREILPK